MNKKYSELLSLIALTSANIAEQVMEQEKQDANAEKMRDIFLNIKDKIDENKELDKGDFANLYIAAGLVTQQLEAKVVREQKVIEGYKNELMPKLLQCANGEDYNVIFTVES